MATIVVNNFAYGLIFGSDVINHGVYLELWDPRKPGPPAILVAFRSDASGEVTITALQESIPLQVVNRFLEAVRAEWPSAEKHGIDSGKA